jgi:methylated-DNA-[protein]-cysteine S-methyltransferase
VRWRWTVTTVSRWGRFLLAATDAGVAFLGLPGASEEAGLAWAQRHDPGVSWEYDHLGQLAPYCRQLNDYLHGRRTEFEGPWDLYGTPCQLQVWATLQSVAYGQVISYQALANRMGRPQAVRAVGRAIARNPVPIFIPCHRVVGSQGRLIGYAGGLVLKRQLLALEGLRICQDRVCRS